MGLLGGDDVLVGENEKCSFYTNGMTRGAEEWAMGWGLEGIRCLVAVQKGSGEKDYLLVRGGQVVHGTKSYEALGVHIDAMAIAEGKKRE